MARAMIATGDTLFVADPPDLIDERQAFYQPDDAHVRATLVRQAEALAGRRGGQLWALTKTSDRVLGRYALDTIPVFDGMASAQGRLYMTTVDSRLLCLGGTGKHPLSSLENELTRIARDQAEDPDYLRPAR